jgi:3-phosphoshikimate 1-carboxyvinyltransferase
MTHSDVHDSSTSQPWAAPSALGPVLARMGVPGSKSATNRALILAALASGPSTLNGALIARDTELMINALRNLGADVELLDRDRLANATLRVTPRPISGPAHIDVGLAGTVMRFVPPMAALADAVITFDGDERARERPLGPMLAAMRDIGVHLDDAHGFLPLRIQGSGHVPGGDVRIDASASSQFVSGLLLTAPRFDHGLRLTHIGAHLPSQPHIEMTLAMLAEHGVVVQRSGSVEHPTWHVPASTIAPIDRTIEPDLSNAAPFLAAAMVTSGQVTIVDWPSHTTQAGDHLRAIFGSMGAHISIVDTSLTIRMDGSPQGIDIDLHEVGELAPVIAAVCAVAKSPSHLHGIGHLRGHETDRLAALTDVLNAVGCEARANDDGIFITPGPLHGAVLDSYGDHRMATAAAVLGLATSDIYVRDIATTAKTMPDFVGLWTAMLEQSA